jgi:hypothetical protein
VADSRTRRRIDRVDIGADPLQNIGAAVDHRVEQFQQYGLAIDPRRATGVVPRDKVFTAKASGAHFGERVIFTKFHNDCFSSGNMFEEKREAVLAIEAAALPLMT